MKLFVNPTSPYVRVVRMAIAEKGLGDRIEPVPVDAWADEPAFLAANVAGRVPALVTDDGTRLSEALLILQHLEALQPEPAILPRSTEGAAVLARAGLAFGIFDAAVEVIIARKSAPDFDGHAVGKKRFRTMREGLARLDADWPAKPDGRSLDLGDIAGVTALDYLVFRFGEVDWRAIAPRLAAFRDAEADRASVRETVPRA